MCGWRLSGSVFFDPLSLMNQGARPIFFHVLIGSDGLEGGKSLPDDFNWTGLPVHQSVILG